jgi:4a-hydroxytetrahydrobiopterin dehydratase
MSTPARLSGPVVDALQSWTADALYLGMVRKFAFTDFKQAFAFMTCVALYAEQHDHHPEWSNVYNRVDIRLTTHDAGGITQRDLDLARYADQVYAQFAGVTP